MSYAPNKAVKVVFDGKRFDSATPFYSNQKILILSDLYKIEVVKFVRNYIYNNLLSSFSGFSLKHVILIEQRDFLLMKTTYIFFVIKQVGCNAASNIKVPQFGILSLKKYRNKQQKLQKEIKMLLYRSLRLKVKSF